MSIVYASDDAMRNAFCNFALLSIIAVAMTDMGKKIGFIGFGCMGSAIARGMLQAGAVEGSDIIACAHRYERLRQRMDTFGGSALESAAEVARRSDIVIMAVKPYQVADVMAVAGKEIAAKPVVSIIAGMPFDSWEKTLGERSSHLSVIPNTPVAVGAGITVFEERHSLAADDMVFVRRMFESIGRVVTVPGSLLGIAGTLTGCGPAFAAMFIEAMADAGVKYGVPRAAAYEMVSQMLLGTATLQLQSGDHPGVMKDAVCSPAGTTIRGVEALERGGFRAAIFDAIQAIQEKKSDK